MIYMQDEPESLKDHKFGRFLEDDELTLLSPEERWNYEQRLKHYRDYRNVVLTAYNEGYASALKERLQNITDELLREKLALTFAKMLKKDRWPTEKITEITEVSEEVLLFL